MPLRWDPLLVRELARELDAALGGARLRALRLDGSARAATLLFREATLHWPLHPTRGAPALLDGAEPAAGDLPLSGRVRGVRSVPDERILVVEVLPTRGRKGALDIVVELLGNQWNLVVTQGAQGAKGAQGARGTQGAEARIRHVLVRRRDARTLVVGAPYLPPEPDAREGRTEPISLERWREIVGHKEGEDGADREVRRRLLSTVAWTSSINAAALVGLSQGDDEAYRLWRTLAFEDPPIRPTLLETTRGPQPYPWPLPGIQGAGFPTLMDTLAAWTARAREASVAADVALLPPELLEELEGAADRALRRVTSLRAELESAEDPALLRGSGDLLLARLAQVPPGAGEVVLEDFEGHARTVPLDPRLAPHENATAYYERAARAERARARIPKLVRAAEEEARRMEALLERARSGDAGVEEVRRALPEPATKGSRPTASGPALPYRRYRSSGGLEIRVGRGAKQNDDLTFHHSDPNDVWLHARHAAGAHVVLRWGRAETPPARDLQEAGVLAALSSRARTSASVPVDWTFRKYVRKPRGSPPGQVVMERARTLFVTPDASVEERLAGWGDAGDG